MKETERDRGRETERDRENQGETESETERDREGQRLRERETERDRERQTETDRDRERETEAPSREVQEHIPSHEDCLESRQPRCCHGKTLLTPFFKDGCTHGWILYNYELLDDPPCWQMFVSLDVRS